MKKLLLALVALTFLFSACNKEGVYAPKKKISTVYYQKTGSIYKKLLNEFFWNGNKLERRLYYGNILSQYIDSLDLVPTYNGNRIVRVDDNFSGEYTEFSYDGKYISKITYHSGDQIAEATVEHKDGKLSKIFVPGQDTKLSQKIMSLFLSQKELQTINKFSQENPKALPLPAYEFKFVWEGDNLVETSTTAFSRSGDIGLIYKSNFKHDDMANPFASNWSDLGNFHNFGQTIIDCRFTSLSKNNVIQIDHEYYIPLPSFGDTIVSTSTEYISYEYDGKYPITATYSDEDGKQVGTHYFEYVK